MGEYEKVYGEFDLSVVVYYELERGAETNARKYEFWRRFVTLCHIIEIDQQVADRAASIYGKLARDGEVIPDADILIAATAQIYDQTLVTKNVEHFKRVDGLRLEKWSE